jgi:hypothetical protein
MFFEPVSRDGDRLFSLWNAACPSRIGRLDGFQLRRYCHKHRHPRRLYIGVMGGGSRL